MTSIPTVPEEIVVLGDPRLRRMSAPVADLDTPEFEAARARLHAALKTFRETNGFGRAISAPQIGDDRRFIACDLGDGAFTLHNPVITWRDESRFTLWDACMSFPELMVKVSRYRSITVSYQDDQGRDQRLGKLSPALASLFQHEIDHLDGVLAVDHALGPDGVVHRKAFDANRDYFDAQVDDPTA
jgi:peptide deformylase